MFSRIFHRNSQQNENAPPVEPQVQDGIETQQPSTIEVQPNIAGVKRKNQDEETPAPTPPKLQRFELETREDNAWDLPSGMVSYLHKYMENHISDKDIRDKILLFSPIPSNIREAHNLDNYIKELLVENKKSLTLNHEMNLKQIQDKIHHILGPLTRVWSMIEEEKEIENTENGQEESPIAVISNLFEQTILLVGQAFNATAYHRRKNILGTLIENSTKVKEILRDQSSSLNDCDNKNLFGDQFEEKLSKDVTAKQKSRSIFTGLKRSLPTTPQYPGPSTQPFRGGSLQRRPRGRGHFNFRGTSFRGTSFRGNSQGGGRGGYRGFSRRGSM